MLPRLSACLALVAAACAGGKEPAHPSSSSSLTTVVRRVDASSPAVAAEADAAPASPGKSPVEKWLAGDRTFGVFSVHDTRCDLASWNATAPRLGLADAVVLPPTATLAGTTISVGAMTGGIVDELAAIFTVLRDFGDSDLDGQHVCVVPAAGVGVALSTGNGYIAFEPAAIVQMNDLIPDAERSMYSSSVALAHELAHQLQFRYGDPFDGDKTVRRSELAADCMGSAFVALTQPSGWIMDEVARGAAGALQAYADLKFRSKHHHGTRADRGRMAKAGIELVEKSRKGGPKLGLATLKRGCEQAVRDWDASQPLTPPDQLWGGTED